MSVEEINEYYKKLIPIIGDDFDAPPLYVPLSNENENIGFFAKASTIEFQLFLDELISKNSTRWSISYYLEDRSAILMRFPQMANEKRFYHLGIDINVPLGTKLYSPFDSDVIISDYEEGDGNYGGFTVLRCQQQTTVFYLLFGHLNPGKLPCPGTRLRHGEAFSQVGDMSQNGNWHYHTHLQALTEKAFANGWLNKGYCKKSDLPTIKEYCPNPFVFL
ncbi:MAG: peptidoglycan DD-metalloendopeptidase family protein [Oscillospiraceae bacterium]|nr:peptidoglycan DD-metalloendopeptidase family protein [Oscillospiraceae bacterium]